MKEWVVDTSILAFAMIGKTQGAADLRKELQGGRCHAPHLIDAELGNVLRKRTLAGDVTSTQVKTALQASETVIDHRYPHYGPLAQLAWTLRDNLSFYDALYVALATQLELPLITGDQKLSRAPGLACRIEII